MCEIALRAKQCARMCEMRTYVRNPRMWEKEFGARAGRGGAGFFFLKVKKILQKQSFWRENRGKNFAKGNQQPPTIMRMAEEERRIGARGKSTVLYQTRYSGEKTP